LIEHRDELECVTDELLRRETLDRQAFELLIHSSARKGRPPCEGALGGEPAGEPGEEATLRAGSPGNGSLT
jgi:hypothetical protein